MEIESPAKQIKDAMTRLEYRLCYGSIEDYTTYRFIVGQLQGLKASLELICNQTEEGEINDIPS